MAKLPKATLRTIMRDEGCQIVSERALIAYREEVERYAYALAEMCNACAKHGGRKTIKPEDVHLAVR